MNKDQIKDNVSYLETLCEITTWCEGNHELPALQKLREDVGSIGMYHEYMDLTLEFEKKYEDVEWDGEWIETVDKFLAEKFNTEPMTFTTQEPKSEATEEEWTEEEWRADSDVLNDLTLEEFKKAVDDKLTEGYLIGINDITNDEQLEQAWRDEEDIVEFIEWLTEKYDIPHKSTFGLK